MTRRPVVVVTRRLPDAVETALRGEFNAQLSIDDRPLDAEALQRAIGRADGILTTVTDKMTAAVLAANPSTARIIANFGVGFDNIDMVAAKAHGIMVTNTPDVLTAATADLAMMLILMATRRAHEADAELREGRWTGWRPTHMVGTELGGKTLGLVGLGRIGSAVAQRARNGFGMSVIGYTTRGHSQADSVLPPDAYRDSLDHLLRDSDIVSLHCPSNPLTRGMMDAARFARMREGSYFVNTARGDLVDDDALIDALRSGHLAGAALDVFRGEPAFDHRYLDLPQLVMLPHLGSATREAREAMGFRALRNLQACFAGAAPPDRVA